MKTRYYILLFCLCLFILTALQPLLYHSFAVDPDAGYFMFMGDSISHGFIPYVTFADNKPPGIWYLLFLVFKIFGKSLYAARGITYLTNALSALLIYFIGRRLWDSKVGIVGSLTFQIGMLLPAFGGWEVYTEPFLVFFSLLGFWAYLKAKENTFNIVLAGFLIGIATLFKQTGILLLIAISLFYIVNLRVPDNRNKKYLLNYVKHTLLLSCGVAIPLLATASYFWSKGALKNFIDYAVFNFGRYGFEFDLYTLKIEFLSYIFIWIVLAEALIVTAYKFFKGICNYKILIAIWLLLTMLPLVSRQYGHYFIQIFPPAVLLASSTIIEIVQKLSIKIRAKRSTLKNTNVTSALVISCVIVFLLLTGGAGVIRYNQLINKPQSLSLQIEVSNYIRDNTSNEDTIIVYPYQPSIYFFSERYPCTTLLIFDSSVVNHAKELELVNQIKEARPKYAVLQTDATGKPQVRLRDVYKLLTTDFQKETSIGIYSIYREKTLITN